MYPPGKVLGSPHALKDVPMKNQKYVFDHIFKVNSCSNKLFPTKLTEKKNKLEQKVNIIIEI